jgi:hypothetical protein
MQSLSSQECFEAGRSMLGFDPKILSGVIRNMAVKRTLGVCLDTEA